MRHRLAEETCPTQKILVPGRLARQEGARIHAGSHTFSIGGQEVVGMDERRVCLAHYPVRGLGQFIAKTVLGHLQNEVDVCRDPALGAHHRDYFDLLKNNPDKFITEYDRLIRTYGCRPDAEGVRVPNLVEDPLPYRGGPLRYTPAISDAARLWPTILGYAQSLAREYGLLRATQDAVARGTLEKQAGILSKQLDEIARRDELLNAQRGELQRLHASLAAASAGWAKSEAHYKALQRSWTWRVGRLVSWPLRSLRRTLLSPVSPEVRVTHAV
jgi:hypothetical protein